MPREKKGTERKEYRYKQMMMPCGKYLKPSHISSKA